MPTRQPICLPFLGTVAFWRSFTAPNRSVVSAATTPSCRRIVRWRLRLWHLQKCTKCCAKHVVKKDPRQGQAERVSNSRNKFHQTWSAPLSEPMYIAVAAGSAVEQTGHLLAGDFKAFQFRVIETSTKNLINVMDSFTNFECV